MPKQGPVNHFNFMKFLKKLCPQGTMKNEIAWAVLCGLGQQSDAAKLSSLVSCVREKPPEVYDQLVFYLSPKT